MKNDFSIKFLNKYYQILIMKMEKDSEENNYEKLRLALEAMNKKNTELKKQKAKLFKNVKQLIKENKAIKEKEKKNQMENEKLFKEQKEKEQNQEERLSTLQLEFK